MNRAYLAIAVALVLACARERNTEPEPPDDSGSWVTIGAGLTLPVTSLCAEEHRLIAATVEESPGRLEAVLWEWNGRTWDQVGPPLAGQVDVMKWFGGALVIGGMFEIDGKPPIKGLAQWNGTSWLAVGDPLERPNSFCGIHVASMVLWRDRLVIGGGLSPDGNLATWDGEVLEIIPDSPLVDALTVWRDALIAAGGPCGDIQCGSHSRLLEWDGIRLSDYAGWIDLLPEDCPPLVHFSIESLLATDEDVIVTGMLPEFGDPSIESVALWTGHEWKPMGSLDGYGGLLVQADTPVIAVATEPYHDLTHVRRWDGEGWIPVGSILDGYIADLAVFEGDLIAGGSFTGSVTRMSPDQLEE